MNINIGDSNHVVRYIQYFLEENHNSDIILSNQYDIDTHNYLIDYMLSPDTVKEDTIIDNIKNYYPFISTNFKFIKGYNEITLQSKTRQTSSEIEIFMTENRTDFMVYCEDYGWTVIYYNAYNSPYEITIKSKEETSPFPRDELIHMINLFDNKFYYGMAMRSGSGTDDIVHQDLSTTGRTYKICSIKASPNSTYCICHNSAITSRLVIGSIITDFTNIENVAVKDVVDIELKPNEVYEYRTTSAVKHILIQIDSQQLISNNSYNFISNILVYKGTKDTNIPAQDFRISPWSVHEQLIGHILEYYINSHSRDDDINYVQDLIASMNSKYKESSDRHPSIYDNTMYKTVKGIQKQYKVPFECGYLDPTTENIINSYLER